MGLLCQFTARGGLAERGGVLPIWLRKTGGRMRKAPAWIVMNRLQRTQPGSP